MALQEIPTNVEYVKWSEVELGTIIKAFYIESKPSAKYPNQMNHYVETLDKKRYGLNGCANLDNALEQIKEGWYIELTYTGTVTLQRGNFAGKDCHQFKLAYDNERIHPLFADNSAGLQPVEYKNNTEPTQAPAPALVKPETQPVAAPPVAAAPSAANPQAASAPSAAPPKRSIF